MDNTQLRRRGLARGKEWVAIVNPDSKGGSTSKGLDKLEAALRKGLGNDLEFVVTHSPSDCSAAVRSALRASAGTVIAIGGDGTANEVANAFMQERETEGASPRPPRKTRTRMGLIPSGTRNVLARSLGLPTDLSRAIDSLRTNKGRPIDMIRVTSTVRIEESDDRTSLGASKGKKTRLLLNAAEIGVGAAVIERSKKIRGVLNIRPVATATSALYTIPAYRSAKCLISLDDGKEQLIPNMTMCIIANGRMIGGGLEAAPLANPSDGLMDVVILEKSGSLKLLGKLLKMRVNDGIKERDVFYSRARKVTVRTLDDRDIMVTVDGEPVGCLPASFEVLHGVLPFLY